MSPSSALRGEMKYQRAVWEDGPNNRRQKRVVDDAVTYPEWCRITVRKLLGGTVVEFSAIEYWIENYASKGDTGEPNAMWAKRQSWPAGEVRRGLKRCGRRSPKPIGSQPTAEEMEGKDYIDDAGHGGAEGSGSARRTGRVSRRGLRKNFSTWRALVASGKKTADEIIAMVTTKGTLSEDQQKRIRDAAKPKPRPGLPAGRRRGRRAAAAGARRDA